MSPRDPDDRPGDDTGRDDEIDLRSLRGGAGPQGSGDDLARLGEIVRSLSTDDLAVDEPPPSVWAGIAARTGVAGRPGPPGAPTGGPEGEAPPDSSPPGPQGPVAPPLRSVEGGGATAPGSRAAPARRPPRTWLLAAAAAVALVVAVGVVALVRGADDDAPVVASADLEPLPDEPTGAATPARADLVDHDGRLQLDLSATDLPAVDGFYEVWLIDTNVEGMVSLGPARDDGTYAVPPDVDPGDFPIVDVSIEPPDGDPTHSGVSVLRGTLS